MSNYVFDLERSAKGLRLNRFLHSLTRREKRELFLQDPNVAMQGLTDAEKDKLERELRDKARAAFALGKKKDRDRLNVRAKEISRTKAKRAHQGTD